MPIKPHSTTLSSYRFQGQMRPQTPEGRPWFLRRASGRPVTRDLVRARRPGNPARSVEWQHWLDRRAASVGRAVCNSTKCASTAFMFVDRRGPVYLPFAPSPTGKIEANTVGSNRYRRMMGIPDLRLILHLSRLTGPASQAALPHVSARLTTELYQARTRCQRTCGECIRLCTISLHLAPVVFKSWQLTFPDRRFPPAIACRCNRSAILPVPA
jgi:hypothetical protein